MRYFTFFFFFDTNSSKFAELYASSTYAGEGNGNPLQCSCLENPGDGEAWWAAVYGVAQSQTRLKRLSNSSTYAYRIATFQVLNNIRAQWWLY